MRFPLTNHETNPLFCFKSVHLITIPSVQPYLKIFNLHRSIAHGTHLAGYKVEMLILEISK